MITQRDLEILEFLYYITYCDSLHLALIFFRWNNDSQQLNKNYMYLLRRRMGILKDYVKKFKALDSNFDIFTLTKEGIKVVEGYLDNYKGIKEKNGYLELYTVKHSQEISKVYLRLMEAHREGRIIINQLNIEHNNNIEYYKDKKLNQIVPDLYLDCVLNGRQKSYYIEIDNNTSSKRKIVKKIERYSDYYKTISPINAPKLIFLCNSIQRVNNLKDIHSNLIVGLKTDILKLI